MHAIGDQALVNWAPSSSAPTYFPLASNVSKLQEQAQARCVGLPAFYEGPESSAPFTCTCTWKELNTYIACKGKGQSKKAAKDAAAGAVITMLDPPPPTTKKQRLNVAGSGR